MLTIDAKPNIHYQFDHDIKISACGRDFIYYSLSLMEIDSLIVNLHKMASDLMEYRYSVDSLK